MIVGNIFRSNYNMFPDDLYRAWKCVTEIFEIFQSNYNPAPWLVLSQDLETVVGGKLFQRFGKATTRPLIDFTGLENR